MHGAALNGQTAAIVLLFKAGGDLFARNMYKNTPFDQAKQRNNAAVGTLQQLMATQEGFSPTVFEFFLY